MATGLKDRIRSKRAPKVSETVLVELSENRIKIASMSELPNLVTVEYISQKSVLSISEKDIGLMIAQVFKERNIKTKSIICSVPSNCFIAKNVDMPSSDPEEIKKIIDLQAGRYTPYSREEIVIDYLSSSKEGQHYTNVLLMIIHRKYIDRLIAVADYAGVEIDRIVCASEAMSILCEGIRQRLPHGNSVVAGIHIAEEFSDLTIADQSHLVFTRSIPVGFRHFSAGRESAETDFTKEVDQSFSAYQSQGVGDPIKLIVLSGLSSLLPYLEGSIKSSVSYVANNPVVFDNVSMAKEFNLSDTAKLAIEKETECSFFSLVCATSTLKTLKLDFIPKEVKLRKHVQEGSRDIVALGILLMTLILLVCMFLGIQIYLKKDAIRRLESVNQKTSDQAKSLEQASTKSRILRNLIDSRGKGLYVFEKISTVIGEDIYLSSFSFDKDDIVKLSGTADSMSRVFAFVTELEESQYFKDVKTNSTKSRREGQREVADFEIECIFSAGAS